MLIQQYLEALSNQMRSPETLRAYRQDLQRFDAFLREKGIATDEVKPSTITEYLAHLEAVKGRTVTNNLSAATISRRLTVVSEYYRWLQRDSEALIRNPVERVKRPKVQNTFNRDVDDAVLAQLATGITCSRDRALLLLFLYSRLRLSELKSLDRNTMTVKRELLPDGSYMFTGMGEVTGKGGKRRTFLVGMNAVQAVAAYLTEQRTADQNPALFLSSRKQRLSDRAIQEILGKWCKRLHVPHVHIHQLRHSYATRNVNAGMSAAVLQTLLGHASLMTTQRYFHIQSERVAREYFSVMEFVRIGSAV